MAPSDQAPFTRLVEHLKHISQSADPISVPTEVLFASESPGQPLEDTGLQDLVKLLEGFYQGERIYLDSTGLAQLVPIIFRLQPSLLQQKLIYTLLAPHQATDLSTFQTWRRSVSIELIPTMLRLMEEGALSEGLLIAAAHSLALFVDGEEEVRSTAYSAQDKLRRNLGSIVGKHESYAVRLTVANLIREFSKGALDSRLFWPDDTPSRCISDFPLAEVADIEWLIKAVEFLSAADPPKAFIDYLSEIYIVQYAEFEYAVATVSDNITLVLPADSQHPFTILQLPLLDGMVCQSAAGSEREVRIQYRRATGHLISQGLETAVEEIRLVLRDPVQVTTFTESVERRLMKRWWYMSAAREPKLVLQRTSYASVDLSQSRQTSFGSEEEAKVVERASGRAISMGLPSPDENQRAADSQHRQEQSIDASLSFCQAESDACGQPSLRSLSPEILRSLCAQHTRQAIRKSIDGKFLNLPTCADGPGSETMPDGQRQLKRPGATGTGHVNRIDVDWEEDLRDENIETEAPVPKKAKTISKQAGKAKDTTTGTTSESTSKTRNKQRKAIKAKVKPLAETGKTSRTRRMVMTKSAKYVEESDPDLAHVDDAKSPLVRGSKPFVTKTPPTEHQQTVHDSQGEQSGSRPNLYDPDFTRAIRSEASNPVQPVLAMQKTTVVQQDTARDSCPEATTNADAVAPNRTSFGAKVAQTLTAKAHLPVTPMPQPSKSLFGDVKEFVQTVNMAREISPQKRPVKEQRSLQRDTHNVTFHEKHTNAQRPVTSTVQHSLSRVQLAQPSRHQPKTSIPHHSPEVDTVQSHNRDRADEHNASTCTTEQCFEWMASPTAQKGAVEDSAASGSTPPDDIELAALAMKQLENSNTVVRSVNPVSELNKENAAKHFYSQVESLETELSKPAAAASKWSPSKPESWKVVPKTSTTTELQKPMNTVPLAHRLERQKRPSPTSAPCSEGDRSLAAIDERVQLETPTASFGAHEQRNKGMTSPSEQSLVVAESSLAPQRWNSTATKGREGPAPSESIRLPALVVARDKHSSHSPEPIDNAEGIPLRDTNACRSLTPGHCSKVKDENAAVTAVEGSATDADAVPGTRWGSSASYRSKVDENGSPRLNQARKLVISSTNFQPTSQTSAHSDSYVFAAYELDHPVYTEGNSPVPVTVPSYHHPKRALPWLNARMTKTRRFTVSQDPLSEKFDGPSGSMNAAALKRQAQYRLSESAMLFDRRSTKSLQARHGPQTRLPLQPQPVHAQIDRAPAPAWGVPLLSALDTHVIRIGPKALGDKSRGIQKTNRASPLFSAGLAKELMPPPPRPASKQGPNNLAAGMTRQCQIHGRFAIEDEDLTLVSEEGSGEHGPDRLTKLSRQQQSPESSTDSQSSPAPQQVKNRKHSRQEDPSTYSPKFRVTQQHVFDILKRTATGVLFRLQRAEEAIQSKTHEYHSGSYTLIQKMETTYEAYIQQERSRAAPRVAELYQSYQKTIEDCSKGLGRVREAAELDDLFRKTQKGRNQLLCLVRSQMEEADKYRQDAALC